MEMFKVRIHIWRQTKLAKSLDWVAKVKLVLMAIHPTSDPANEHNENVCLAS